MHIYAPWWSMLAHALMKKRARVRPSTLRRPPSGAAVRLPQLFLLATTEFALPLSPPKAVVRHRNCSPIAWAAPDLGSCGVRHHLAVKSRLIF